MFDGYHMKGNEAVLLMTENGTVENIVPITEAGDDVQDLKGILSPGFVNCHCHLELSHMKSRVPEMTGLTDFVSQVMKNRHLPEEQILAAVEQAEEEMLSSGIVAVGDICNNTLTIPQKIKRRISYHNFIEASGFLPQMAGQRFERAAGIFHEYARDFPGPANSIVPHAPYSVSAELWQLIVRFPGNQLMTIHNQESAAENELFFSKEGEMLKLYEAMGTDISFFQPSGKSSLQTCLSRFLPNQQVILVHNIHTSPGDLLSLKLTPLHPKLYWCFCPGANLYIGGQLPDIDLLQKENQSIVLGTDSLASNHQLSILAEMRTILQYFPSVTFEQLFSWATINGAKALQMDNLLGSFEKGKQPGVVLNHNDLSASRRII